MTRLGMNLRSDSVNDPSGGVWLSMKGLNNSYHCVGMGMKGLNNIYGGMCGR